MTEIRAVTSETNRINHNPDGFETSFVYDFPVREQTWMKVYADGILYEEPFTMTGLGGPGGRVNFTTAPSADIETLTLIRDVPLTQTAVYPEYGPFPAKVHEGALDKLTWITQQLKEEIGRCTRAPIDGEGIEFPPAETDKVLIWNSEGNLVNGPSEQTFLDILADCQGAEANAADNAQNASNCSYQSFLWSEESKTAANRVPEPAASDAGKTLRANAIGTYDLVPEISNQTPLMNSTVLANWTTALNLNTVSTLSFTPVLWTGNGTSQDIVTGIDSRDFTVSGNGSGYWLDRTVNQVKNDAGVVQASGNASWGNNATGLSKVHIKCRSTLVIHGIFDGLRGVSNIISTDQTASEALNPATLTAFSNTGFSVGSGLVVNGSLGTYVAYQELYTHVTWGTTNHGKFYIEAYNPITGAGMIYYVGSGVTDHRIPHSQGVVLDYFDTKDLTNANGWMSIRRAGYNLALQSTAAEVLSSERALDINDTYVSIGTSANLNGLNSEYICYYKRNSDVWRIVEYTGTGAAGNSIYVGFKPARATIKRLTGGGDWPFMDNKRGEAYISFYNLSVAEQGNNIVFTDDGVIINWGNVDNFNTLNEDYLLLVEADTNADGGGSYFDRPTDGLLNVNNGIFNYSKGLTDKGYDLSSKTVTKSIDASAVANGEWWISENEDGSLSWIDTKPQLVYSPTGVAYKDGAWYEDGVLLNPAPSFIPVSVTVATGKIQQINTDDQLPINQAPRTAFVEGVDIYYSIFASGLPTADPFIEGYCWSDNGVIKISGGI